MINSDIILFVLIVGLHAFWIYKVATYDWNNFEEDSKADTGWPPYD
jgi:hypothetical protein